MYKSYYSLAYEPFPEGLKISDSFQSRPYQEALSGLDYLKRTKGIGLLLGEPGAGKTFTLRTFKESLNPSLYQVIYFPLSTGVMDFYRAWPMD